MTDAASPDRPVDADFTALPLRVAAGAALAVAEAAGAEHADLRVQRIRTYSLRLHDGDLQSESDVTDLGLAVRVLVEGTWGFAATTTISADAARSAAHRAVEVARTLAPLSGERVELAPEPVHADASWVGAYEMDPWSVPAAERVGALAEYSARLLRDRRVSHVMAHCLAVKEQTFYADLAGSTITQQRVRVAPELDAVATGPDGTGFDTMRTLAPPVARGWEYLSSSAEPVRWDWDGELETIPELLAEKLTAPSVEPGPRDLVIDPTNLWLTIHESIGHATEYDRAIGYEAAYAGTSFATPDLLGRLRYGSQIMNVTADRDTPHGLATVGYDDDGVATGQWDLIRGGVLAGYQLDRAFAHRAGLARSNGCAYADSAHHVPMQRMANVSLQPDPERDTTTEDLIAGVDDGLYVVGDKSWSIDMQRYNFQFTGQRFYRIRGGRLAGQVRDVAYQATTTDFWGAMEAVGGPSTWRLGGAVNCGKGQPGQVAAVSHGCPSVVVRGVNILNTAAEGGDRA